MRVSDVTTSLPAQQPVNRFQLLVISAAIMLAMAFVLFMMGRAPICSCGTIKLWHGAVNSSENSQHLLDWYTPSHVIHGFLFFGIFAVARRWTAKHWTLAAGLVFALFLEAAWEIVENAPAMINRYRTATIALGYNGDSIINSIADVLAMTAGFLLAARLPVLVSIILVVAAEILVVWMIRDNLLLNIIMLIWPQYWIKAWQAGG
jgi:Protein of unknown function (DUF2585)